MNVRGIRPRGDGLFKVTVPQAVEEIAGFNNSKKCSLSSGDFQRRSYIFCAAVVNEKRLSSVQKSHRCNQRERPRQRKICTAIDKDRASPSNDNFLITVRFSGRFVPLVTVLFVGKGG